MARSLAIQRLAISNVRNLKQLELNPAPGVNVIAGANGSGKTSLLEAIHILGRGRSFRTRKINDWITRGENTARIVASTTNGATTTGLTKLGLERDRSQWQARINGETVTRFGDLSRQLPLIVFEPNAHELISGGPEQRRAFLDWGVFHVEQKYLQSWRRYQRSLRQRNSAIREQVANQVIHSLTPGIVEAAENLDEMRLHFFTQLQQAYTELKDQLQPQIPDATLIYHRGWPAEQSLSELLHNELPKDVESGYTRQGPHRADIGMQYQQRQLRGWLSRGQQKLTALLLLLSQQTTWKSSTQLTPIIMLDDLYSELDEVHSSKVLKLLKESQAQVWITTAEQRTLTEHASKVFHVEHGQILEQQ